MVLGDKEEEGMLRKLEKKSKKNKGKLITVLETMKERDKEVIETKATVDNDGCDVKRKKKKEGGKCSERSNKDSDEDAVRCVEKKKNNKLKRSCLDETLDTKTSAPTSASEKGDKVVETLGKVSDGNVVDEIKRKKKSKKNTMTTSTIGAGVTNTEVKSMSDDCDIKRKKDREHGKHSGKFIEDSDEVALKVIEGRKSNKLKKRCRDERETNIEDGQEDIAAEVNQGNIPSPTEEREEQSRIGNSDIRKRKKVKLGDSSEDPTHEKSEKRVRFSGHDQIFPSSSDPSDEKHEIEEDNLLRGKRFSKLEDETVKEAVHKYIEIHNLGEEGLKKILNSRSYPELRGCWKEIGSAIPYRPYLSVYYRAQVLFRRSETRKWTEEEYEIIRKYQKEHGNNWKVLAEELGKARIHVKDTWRRLKLPNQNKGQWTQVEYQTLFDLVNTDLRLRLSEEKKSKYGMLRDNIAWGAISDQLSTRTGANCCLKWYDQLTSSMVAKGEWADTDDYRLIDALFELDASCIEDVDWDNLLDHRSGEICRKRWNQMVLHIGQLGNKSFAEQVEVLAKRYRPDLVEVREAWDSKPIVT
ncbi:hypothetical protein HAX54_003496 [Datura stramonium]|uniref:Uncharacterized protein n=1 Tax=Datura stramonium TaxID=4076 RepID=A0ABS8RTD4_DATST|nr:hypothetical protein [Datura stramonium]